MKQFTPLLLWAALTAAASPAFAADTVSLPYFQDFETDDALAELTIINSNDDYKFWELKDGHAWLQYNAQMPSDDWLILPGMNFSSGKGYIVRFDAWAHLGNFYPERMEVRYGTSPTAAGMTVAIMEPTVLTNKEGEPTHFEYTIMPTADGVYYIGFHGISDADQSGLYLDNIEVSEKSLQVPGEPTEFTVTPDPAGSNRTTISLKAPSTSISGTALESLTKVEILREGEVIHTVENPTPGQAIEYVDTEAKRGLTRYAAAGYTADGRGGEAFATVFVGINTPAPVPSVSVSESTSKPGQVTISWEVPTVDIEGNPINPDMITYEVVERNGIYTQNVIKSGIRGTSYTYQAVAAGDPQQFKQWGVYSYTDNGTLHDTRTDLKAIGRPYDAPYAESFADGEAASISDNKFDSVESEWHNWTDEDRVGVKAQDGDNGFSGLVAESQESFGVLTLGKVSLKDVENPGISLYLYNPAGAAGPVLDIFEIQIYIDDEWKTFKSFALETLPKENAWNRLCYSLADYKGRTVQFRFLTVVKNGGLVLIDNVRIGELYAHNIGGGAIHAPWSVKANTEFNINVTVENLGTEPFEGYDVTLYRNGSKIATLPGAAVAVADEVQVSFTDCLGVAMDSKVYYNATIESPADEYAADNEARRATVELAGSGLPAPQNLCTAVDNSSVTISWEAPDMTQRGVQPVTESFEYARSWAVDEVPGWTFYDADGSDTYLMGQYNYPNKGGKMAYQVFDNESEGFAMESSFDAASGHKFLACYSAKSKKNDDWAISPLLNGEAQTISLAASSMNMAGTGYQYLETFEILYSTSGTAMSDFTLLREVRDVPEQWTAYSFDLPAGTRYFAIRCTSEDKYVFMVDDVTYIPAATFDPASFAGYNVYRDGLRINSTPVAERSFTDSGLAIGDYTYVVSAIYGPEESDISNLATARVTVSGISDASADGLRILSGRGYIAVSGTDSADIYTLDGRLAATITADGGKAAVAPGIYIVRAGAGKAKVTVK